MPTALRSDFNDFLFAPIARDANGISVTVLSALARLGVDPWVEAADLADLPRESATEKLIAVLAVVPNGPSPGVDTANLASQLVALLHPSRKSRVLTADPLPSRATVLPQTKRNKLAIYYLLALIVMLVGYWVTSNRHAPAPTSTSQPSSR